MRDAWRYGREARRQKRSLPNGASVRQVRVMLAAFRLGSGRWRLRALAEWLFEAGRRLGGLLPAELDPNVPRPYGKFSGTPFLIEWYIVYCIDGTRPNVDAAYRPGRAAPASPDTPPPGSEKPNLKPRLNLECVIARGSFLAACPKRRRAVWPAAVSGRAA
jgi:hypothetical protein